MPDEPATTATTSATCAIGNCRHHQDWTLDGDNPLGLCDDHFRLTRVAGWQPTQS